MTSLYKIIAKVLPQWLQWVFCKTVHIFQGAFIERQILDAILVTNEVVDDKRHYKPEVVFKIDFEKAFFFW